MTDFARHGSQIFADHNEIAAHAFERQNSHEIVCVVPYVSSLTRLEFFWNPVQAEETHHVVDTQSSSRLRRTANRLRK